MKKQGNMFLTNLRYLCLIGVIALGLMTITGSSGQDGGSGNNFESFTYKAKLQFGDLDPAYEYDVTMSSECPGGFYDYSEWIDSDTLEFKIYLESTTGDLCNYEITIECSDGQKITFTNLIAHNFASGFDTLVLDTGFFESESEPDSDDDPDESQDEEGLIIYDEVHSSSATTDSEGKAVLDTTSFNYEIQIELTNEKGYVVPNINVSYSQETGKAELILTDSSGVYAPSYIFVDFAQAVSTSASSISYFQDSSERVVVSGAVLIIGGVLAFYTGWEAGEALYEVYEFAAENLEESDIWHTSYECTVGEFTDVIPDVLTLVKLPLSTASNVTLVASGGATLKLHKAIDIGADFTAGQIESRLIDYLCHMTGELIGPDTEIEVTFYHFGFLIHGAAGALSIEVVDAGNSYQGSGILVLSVSPSDPAPYESAVLTATLKPAEENVEIILDLDGTDNYTKDETKTTDSNGP